MQHAGRARARLSACDRARLRSLQECLGVVVVDGPPLLDVLVPALRDALGLDSALAYGIRPVPGGPDQLTFVKSVGCPEPHFSSTLRAHVAREGGMWSPTKECNRVFAWRPADLEGMRASLYRDLCASAGMPGFNQLHVLVCEHTSPLGWFGGWQRGGIEPRQRAMLQALVPDLRRRLLVERRLADSADAHLLKAALEEIGRAAFVVDGLGRIIDANPLALEALKQASEETERSIADALRARAEHPRWSVTTIAADDGNGVGASYLVVARPDVAGVLRARIACVARRWGLTARQREVLEHVGEGNTNQSIAAMLGISERTIEIHITALFDKAGVQNRAELVARLFAAEEA